MDSAPHLPDAAAEIVPSWVRHAGVLANGTGALLVLAAHPRYFMHRPRYADVTVPDPWLVVVLLLAALLSGTAALSYSNAWGAVAAHGGLNRLVLVPLAGRVAVL